MEFTNIRQSEAAGIVIIHQELALIPELSIAENIFLGNETASGGVINWDARQPAGHRAARPGRPAREPAHPGQAPRRRQAAARGDRQGAVQGGQAAHPRRADGRAQRRRLPAPARPAQGPAGQGHHLDHDQPQAQRDRAGRRRDHDHPRRPHHRDARRRRGRRRRGPDHPRDGRPRPRAPLPRARAGDRRRPLRDLRLDGDAPARPRAGRHQGREPPRPARRDRRYRRPDGRRAHRARP